MFFPVELHFKLRLQDTKNVHGIKRKTSWLFFSNWISQKQKFSRGGCSVEFQNIKSGENSVHQKYLKLSEVMSSTYLWWQLTPVIQITHNELFDEVTIKFNSSTNCHSIFYQWQLTVSKITLKLFLTSNEVTKIENTFDVVEFDLKTIPQMLESNQDCETSKNSNQLWSSPGQDWFK